jgi:hypothetical protein
VAEAQELEQNGFSFKGKHYQFKLSAFACDTPARSLTLNIKGHTGYFGCPKCIQQGDYEGRVVFLERNAPLRTNESFRNRIHEDHHNGDSILELLDLDMVLDFPVDPMHLVDLGVCRKLLLTWIRGPLERRLPKNLVEIISARLELLRDYIPREFARLSRSLKFIDRWKVTEFVLFVSYIGPVVLAGILSSRLFNNFLVLHVAVRILSSNKYCVDQNEYARKLLNLFVSECERIYIA